MISQFTHSFLQLKSYCESENFAGWDPFDGLNSEVFQATPLKHWRFARLAWIQAFKRSPINFRRLLLVPKEHNPKGIALFLSGYCNIYQAQAKSGSETYGSQDEVLEKINYLANLLISLQSKGYAGACWGYNFDWQNRVFFQPKHTPTIVPTSFCAEALFNAYELTKNKNYLNTALSSCDFILQDINRNYVDDTAFIFSYSPLDNSQVYNASLLGASVLARAYSYTKDEHLKNIAKIAVNAIVNKQQADGSWVYGEAKIQAWIDSFHTGYNLDALQIYQECTGDNSYQINIDKGFDYYIQTFFLEDGTPKYYHNKTYPIDIHCPAQLLVSLSRLHKMQAHQSLANRVLQWSITHMQNPKGYFYYQLKPNINSQISYMRWSNAFMFYAMSFYLKEGIEGD